MSQSNAYILSEHAINMGWLTRPSEKGEWPVYVGLLPDGTGDPDDAVAYYDTAGILHGKSLKDGEVFKHSGLMVHVRSPDYLNAYDKADDLSNKLSALARVKAEIQGEMFLIQSVTLTSDIAFMGISEVRNRRKFSFNAIVSLSRI